MILETVEIFVAFPAHVTSVRLVLLHAHSPWVWTEGFWVDNGKGAIVVRGELLRVVSML